MKVKKEILLFLACVVWLIAGINVLRIGIECYSNYLSILNVILSVLVFFVFQFFVFGKLVRKHSKRIMGYEEEKHFFLKFFDIPSFIIMAFMMSMGIWLRVSGIAPEIFIAVFYSGIGASLTLAGILFGINFLKNIGGNKLCKE